MQGSSQHISKPSGMKKELDEKLQKQQLGR